MNGNSQWWAFQRVGRPSVLVVFVGAARAPLSHRAVLMSLHRVPMESRVLLALSR